MAISSGRPGYFGKLPARADFVTRACPAGFLRLWEAFLLKGLAQSRLDLKDTWKDAYMTMPVWRFRLSPCETGGLLTGAVAGALMPSIDGVGREFPLTIVAPFDADGVAAAPADAWYDEVETVLLNVLEDGAALEAFQTAVARLDLPVPASGRMELETDGDLAAMAETEGEVRSDFWCRAGEGHYAFRCSGLPDANAFRWLLLPDAYGSAGEEKEEGGKSRGLYHPEDNRT
ncbi:type VI secretion system-associated protein TagF [Roseibium salinum]|uniref:Type VI secretion system-associated protein TagF n=1 Tax=Roseibium salinum TaxID=1604349 RepID=A0ABT3R189_9HYPH|nr:type VI secretion system-associated protein TagF [Roseibium sp. DSM 29163]MCX2722924.1 type VI secretion system-associated protein TagF [Roseibium sp. DSM 29163]MDN3719147.1 type VI secretion system-associated protein TagF [Roseibium salinum]